MAATNLKLKNVGEKLKVATRATRATTARNVINLFEGKRARRSVGLTEEARAELVLTYRIKARKLARSILRKWHARLDLQEVDSVVDLSLCEAVRRFNPAKGASFMTFLFYHMRGNLIRAVTAAATANAVPVGEYGTASGESTASGNAALSRGINAMEIAEALSSQEYVSPDESLLKKEVAELSGGACSKLDPLEREVIMRIYVHEQQLMDIAHSLGYSRCHISRVKKKALEALHRELSSSLELTGVPRPDFSNDEDLGDRRKIHRRRPRAKHAVRRILALAERQAAAS
jgi:RNA polymerase sigma factor (sigma-70 family)